MSSETDRDVLPDRIYDTLQGKTVMITGGTGFVGKVCIETLLRAFDVAKIYILIRAKKGLQPSERLSTFFSNPLFDKVRNLKGDGVFDKCVGVSGDVSLDNLAISEEDRLAIERDVEIVIHAAATVRFDEPLKIAINTNTKGTYSMLELAKGMKRLLVFVHVSTAYCHPEEKELFEKFYKAKYNPMQVINMVNFLDDQALQAVSKPFLKDVPNTYALSKALSEDLIANAIDGVPVIVLRPSIVMPVWKEPIPGWSDNFNGPIGLMTAAGKGVCRSMLGDRNIRGDFVTADLLADAICVVGAYAVLEGFDQRVFNICANDEFKVTWGEFIDIARRVGKEEVPFDVVLWPPGGDLRKNWIVHYWMVLFAQLIPALILDPILWCLGYKPFLWRVQMRIAEGQKILSYYANNEWTFNNDQALLARKWLNARERDTYTVSADALNMEKYTINATLAIRKYLLNEPEVNLPRARRIMKIRIWIDRVCNVLLKVLLAYLFYKWVLLSIYNRL